MTSVNFIYKKKNEIIIEVKGHAEAERNENGNDLVCCACSTLLYTLLNSLSTSTMCNVDEIAHALIDNEMPNIIIKLKAKENTYSNVEMNVVVKTIKSGFELLEKKYKKNVKVLTTFL